MSDIMSSNHISSIMDDLGYSCCENPSTLKEVLSQFVGPTASLSHDHNNNKGEIPKEYDVALILATMARTHRGLEAASFPLYRTFPPANDQKADKGNSNDSSSKTGNINVFVEVLRELVR